MSRPISVEELVAQGLEAKKPKFISKAKRDRLKATKQKPAPFKVVKPEIIGPLNETSEPRKLLPVKAPRQEKNKGLFSWDDSEDTSGSYQPLVLAKLRDDDDDLLSSESHWSTKPLERMKARDWRLLKHEFDINYKGEDLGNPLRAWNEEQALPKRLINLLQDLKYYEPTPIQRAAIPIALRHRDVVGIAETGSGKTLAYLLPILTYLMNIEEEYMTLEHCQDANLNKTLALILAPTRELALQITKEAEKFCKSLGYNVVTIIGGHQYEETIHSLRNGVHIVVATPGRLIDSLERGLISLEKCYHLTMDEADKMIDMGFEKPLSQILLFMPDTKKLNSSIDSRILRVSKRSTLMFTATISSAIEKITKNYLTTPGYVFVGGANSLVDNIDQKFEYLDNSPPDKQLFDAERFNELLRVLHSEIRGNQFSVIIFANFKRVVEQLAEELSGKGFGEVATIHGSKSQEAREKAIQTFREKLASILIATDVAARGIDIPHVSMVVNYQMSNKFEEYIHRVGRTGRAGHKGKSYTFIDEGDKETFPELRKFLWNGGLKIPEWLSRTLNSGKKL
ncbi:hypothetical protein PUMCH_004194 [Australozyma saopauloensis]|uniref:RNA helicase n=1 Tax=Australozyma saopauloensis TaxID=291208 RepID=A0AAX4HG21_9ASCO|nr:hypothetical protein PUMCH_004194 [[Candida] saopauloensis]